MDQYAGLLFLALPLLLLYVVFSRGRRQQRALAATQARAEAGSQVMTTSGLFGQVVSTSEQSVVLEVAPGVHTTWARQAIAQVLDEPAVDEPAAAAANVIDLTSDPDPPGPRAASAQDDEDHRRPA